MLENGYLVTIRWRTLVPGSGYDLWDGDRWVPVADAEVAEYRKRRYAIHVNPRWAQRG